MNGDENMRDLIDRFIDGKSGEQDVYKLYHAINNEDIPEGLKAWFYSHWEGAAQSKGDYNPSSVFGEIINKASITKEKRDEDKEYLEFKLNKKLNYGRKKILIILKYAAILMIAFIASSLIFQNVGSETFISDDNNEIINQLSVPKGSKTSLILSDGTEIWLNAESKLKYPAKFNNENREVFIEGEGYFDVAEDESHPFIVHTENIKIKVLGTKFNVKSYPDDDRIETTLITGSIVIEEVQQKPVFRNKTLHLKPNDHAIFLKSTNELSLFEKITRNAKPVQSSFNIKKVNRPEDLISWKDNKLVFKRAKFSKVINELERWYNVHINLEFDDMKDYTYSGTFEDETIEQALEALRITTPFEYKINKNRITISKPK